MAVNLEDISPRRCIEYANEVAELCGLDFPKIASVTDINSKFFVSLFEHITNQTVLDKLSSEGSETEAHNIQAVIDTLSLDLLGLSLSHITGEDIVSGNVISIINLLEVLEAIVVHSKKEESFDTSYPKENSSSSSSTFEHINNTIKLVKTSSEDEENVPPSRILKRKTCRNTLSKPHQWNLNSQRNPNVSVLHHSRRKKDTNSNLKPHLKRKSSKPVETIYKRPNVEGIEDLHKSNFEKRVKALLLSDNSPVMLAKEIRSKYIQSLRPSLKRTCIAPCKKSYLLPHNLRPKSKSPVRIKRMTSCRIQRIKPQLYDNTKSNVQDRKIPAPIQSMLKEFPGFQFSENTLELLKKDYHEHISSIHKQLKDVLLKKPATVIQTENAMEEETKLSKILTKDLQEKSHLRKIKEHKAIESRIKASLRDARMQSIKMKQYFEEFHKAMSRKLGKRNFSEEILIEKTFKQMLDLQKEKVRLLCKRIREADDYDAVQHRIYLDSLKNVYQEQLDLLAESVNAEQKESFEREKAKRLATDKMNREILKTLQKEVRSLQKDVLEMVQDIHFRELDAQNFIENCQTPDS